MVLDPYDNYLHGQLEHGKTGPQRNLVMVNVQLVMMISYLEKCIKLLLANDDFVVNSACAGMIALAVIT